MKLLAEELGCKTEKLSVKYLDMLLEATPRGYFVYETIIKRMEHKLAQWKTKYLTEAWRITLMKIILSSLPMYYLSILTLPMQVKKELNNIMRRRLWGTKANKLKVCWIAWINMELQNNGWFGHKKHKGFNYLNGFKICS